MKFNLLQALLFSLFIVNSLQTNEYSVILTAPQQLTAVASVTTDKPGEDFDTMIAIGYADNSYLILNKPFKAKKTRVYFSDINEQVTYILNVSGSEYAVIFFETKFVIINIEDAFNKGTYNSPYDIAGDYEVDRSVSIRSGTFPTIAKSYVSKDEWQYALVYISSSSQLYAGIFTIDNGVIKNYLTQSISGASSATQSAVFLYSGYGLMIAYSNPSTIYFYSLVSMDIIASDQNSPNFTNQLSALSAPEGTKAIVASDNAGLVKAIGLPKKVSGYDNLFQNSVELRETLFDGTKLGTNSVSKITPVTFTEYILVSGASTNLMLTEIFNSDINDKIDDQNSVQYVGQKVDYLFGTGLMVMQNFNNKDSTNLFNKEVILYKICGQGLALSLSENGCQAYDSDDDYDDQTGVLKDCGYTTYYSNGSCYPCPSTCNICSSYSYYDYSTDTQEDCQTCDEEGQCICRHDKKCDEGQTFDFDECACIGCSDDKIEKTQCLSGMKFSEKSCGCVPETCSDNEKCALCDEDDKLCLECVDDAMSIPECVCYLGYYFNYDENICKVCQDPQCQLCTGDNGEVCISDKDGENQYQSSERQSDVAYPFYIVAGVAGSYLIVFMGAKSMKMWKRRNIVTENNFNNKPGPSKSIFPEYSKQNLTNKPDNIQSMSSLPNQQHQNNAGVEISTNDNISNPASEQTQYDNRSLRKNRRLEQKNRQEINLNNNDNDLS